MAVEVIFTIASRSLRIFGSGTFSTCTVLRPDQTFARMSDPHLLELGLLERLRRALLRLALERLAGGERLGARHLAGLELRLEAAQSVLHHRDRLVSLDFLHSLAQQPGLRVV